jgi:hypothetical protein
MYRLRGCFHLSTSAIENVSKGKCVGTKHDKIGETKSDISSQGDTLNNENA